MSVKAVWDGPIPRGDRYRLSTVFPDEPLEGGDVFEMCPCEPGSSPPTKLVCCIHRARSRSKSPAAPLQKTVGSTSTASAFTLLRRPGAPRPVRKPGAVHVTCQALG